MTDFIEWWLVISLQKYSQWQKEELYLKNTFGCGGFWESNPSRLRSKQALSMEKPACRNKETDAQIKLWSHSVLSGKRKLLPLKVKTTSSYDLGWSIGSISLGVTFKAQGFSPPPQTIFWALNVFHLQTWSDGVVGRTKKKSFQGRSFEAKLVVDGTRGWNENFVPVERGKKSG